MLAPRPCGAPHFYPFDWPRRAPAGLFCARGNRVAVHGLKQCTSMTDLPRAVRGFFVQVDGIFEHLEGRLLDFPSPTAHWPHVRLPHDLPHWAAGALRRGPSRL
jgi:hypothetical protein